MELYILADPARRTLLNQLWPEFDEQLQVTCEEEFEENIPVIVEMNDGSSIQVNSDDIVIQQPYKENAWNNFPEVEPPTDTLMRCERYNSSGNVDRYAAYYDGKHWLADIYGVRTAEPNRFRPWER